MLGRMDQDFLGYAPLEKLLLPFRKILTPIMMYKYQNIGIAFFHFWLLKAVSKEGNSSCKEQCTRDKHTE